MEGIKKTIIPDALPFFLMQFFEELAQDGHLQGKLVKELMAIFEFNMPTTETDYYARPDKFFFFWTDADDQFHKNFVYVIDDDSKSLKIFFFRNNKNFGLVVYDAKEKKLIEIIRDNGTSEQVDNRLLQREDSIDCDPSITSNRFFVIFNLAYETLSQADEHEGRKVNWVVDRQKSMFWITTQQVTYNQTPEEKIYILNFFEFVVVAQKTTTSANLWTIKRSPVLDLF